LFCFIILSYSILADTISDLGYANELANYGEYSGAPSTEHTYEYAKTLIELMTKHEPSSPKGEDGKIFIIGGSIANFTDIAATFAGLIKALRSYCDILLKHNVSIWVRRAGPNYQEGLQMLRECSNTTGLDIKIYGPETHITAVVPLALGLEDIEDFPQFDDPSHLHKKELAMSAASRAASSKKAAAAKKSDDDDAAASASASAANNMKRIQSFHGQIADHEADHSVENFTAKTRCVVYGLMPVAVQGMLDFDFMCKREKPSVAAMIFPFSANHYMKVRNALYVFTLRYVTLRYMPFYRRRFSRFSLTHTRILSLSLSKQTNKQTNKQTHKNSFIGELMKSFFPFMNLWMKHSKNILRFLLL
jgi:ATP citrate (pro-S)-lyase